MSLLGKIVGGTVGFVVAGPVGAVAGAEIGGSKQASAAGHAAVKGVSEAAKYTEEVVEGVGKVIVSGGVVIIDAIANVGQALLNVAEGVVAFRPLRPAERQIAQQVFQGSVPLDRVVLSTLIGAGHRPFTIPGSMIMSAASTIPGIGPLLDVAYLLQNLQSKYVIFIGGAGYNNALNMGRDRGRRGQTLIHELTHVWQSHNNAFQWGYVLNSAWKQCTCGTAAAYAMTPGGQWRDYDAEPQAMLVEEWYVKDATPVATVAAALTANQAIKSNSINSYQGVTGFHQVANPGLGGMGLAKPAVTDPALIEADKFQIMQSYINSNIRTGHARATTVFPSSTSSSTRNSAIVPLKLR